jgi:hypothetical protein
MRPAGRLDNTPGLEQSVEAGVAVGVHYTDEKLKVSPRVLAFAIG